MHHGASPQARSHERWKFLPSSTANLEHSLRQHAPPFNTTDINTTDKLRLNVCPWHAMSMMQPCFTGSVGRVSELSSEGLYIDTIEVVLTYISYQVGIEYLGYSG